jgi:hypothetical protein
MRAALHRLAVSARAYPGLSLVILLTLVACAYFLKEQAQAYFFAPDPQVISQPMSYQRVPEPIPNTGVDAAGLTLDEFQKRGGQPKDYAPIRKSVFKPGESLWVLRYECFLYKTQEGTVSRAFLGGDGSAGTNRSVYSLPDVQIPTRTDGCAVKNHRTPIPVDLPPGTWSYQATVNFFKSQFQPSVRVLFKPVIVDVVAAPAGQVSGPGKP